MKYSSSDPLLRLNIDRDALIPITDHDAKKVQLLMSLLRFRSYCMLSLSGALDASSTEKCYATEVEVRLWSAFS